MQSSASGSLLGAEPGVTTLDLRKGEEGKRESVGSCILDWDPVWCAHLSAKQTANFPSCSALSYYLPAREREVQVMLPAGCMFLASHLN